MTGGDDRPQLQDCSTPEQTQVHGTHRTQYCTGAVQSGSNTPLTSTIKRRRSFSRTRVDSLHKTFVRGLDQLLCFFVHLTDKEGFIQVTMETVVVDGDVHCAQVKTRDERVIVLEHERIHPVNMWY